MAARDEKAAHGFSWPNAVLNNTGSSARSCSPCILLHTAAYCCIRITVHHCTLYTTAHYILLTTAIYIPGTPNTTLPLHTTFTAWAQVVLQGGVASDQEGASLRVSFLRKPQAMRGTIAARGPRPTMATKVVPVSLWMHLWTWEGSLRASMRCRRKRGPIEGDVHEGGVAGLVVAAAGHGS